MDDEVHEENTQERLERLSPYVKGVAAVAVVLWLVQLVLLSAINQGCTAEACQFSDWLARGVISLGAVCFWAGLIGLLAAHWLTCLIYGPWPSTKGGRILGGSALLAVLGLLVIGLGLGIDVPFL